MKPLRRRLEEVRKKGNHRFEILQQDYILSWVLFGLYEHPILKDDLIFKGGTALKKCFFGDYRFSEDLDFSVSAGFLKGKSLFQAINEMCEKIQERVNIYLLVPKNPVLQDRDERRRNHSLGFCWFSMYCLTTEIGAPPQLPAK